MTKRSSDRLAPQKNPLAVPLSLQTQRKHTADLSFEAERGRIYISSVKFSSHDPAVVPTVTYQIVNIGRTPAQLILSRMYVRKFKRNSPESVPLLSGFEYPFQPKVYYGKILNRTSPCRKTPSVEVTLETTQVDNSMYGISGEKSPTEIYSAMNTERGFVSMRAASNAKGQVMALALVETPTITMHKKSQARNG